MSEKAITPEAATIESLGAEDLSYEDFERWRETGEDKQSEAPADKPEAESGPESEPEKKQEQEEGDETKAGEPKRKGGFQRRIDKLTREKHELEARVAALEAHLAEPAGEKTPQKPPEKPDGDSKFDKTPDDFETYEEYVEKLTEWKLDQREKARARAEALRRAEEAEKELFESWAVRAEAARKAHEDYDEALESADDVPIPWAMQQAILESPLGPEIAYHLAKNRAEAERIAGLAPVAAAREIGKLEAALTPKKTDPAPKPKITGAPKPVTPVTGGASKSAFSPDDPNIPYEQWERQRNAQLLRGRR